MVDPTNYRGITVTSIDFGVLLDTNEIVNSLSSQATTKLAKALKNSFPRSGEKARPDLNKIIQDVNVSMVEPTRKAILDAYTSGKKGRRPYRFGDSGKKMKRYSRGQMEKGINSERFIKANGTGITISLLELDRYAKQWARLNFGAKPRGSVAIKDEKIRLFRKSLNDSPSLKQIGARRGFMVPPTKRAVAVGSSKAYGETPSPRSIAQSQNGPYLYLYAVKTRGLPKRKFRTKETRGIQGWRFLDKGINEMNKQYGAKLTEGLNKWVKQLNADVAKSVSKESGNVEVRVRGNTAAVKRTRSESAKRGWETRRENERNRKRSEAAKKGAETRRRNRKLR